MLREDDDLSWYARKAVRLGSEGLKACPDRAPALNPLLGRLKGVGIKGDFGSCTLFTRRLPPGCRECLKGRGSNLYVTGLCTRECFFCFNQRPRKDETVIHGFPVREPFQAAEIVRRYGLRSVGISGGEPLLFPERVQGLIRALRALPHPPRIDLYTNGDRSGEALLRRLQEEGLDSVRFNLAARDYDPSPLPAALRVFPELAVEIPVIPRDMARLKAMVLELDRLGVAFLIIHELFLCAENGDKARGEGHVASSGGNYRHLLWHPAEQALEAALELLIFAQERARILSVYFCSCGTQETISRRGWLRRLRLGGYERGPWLL
jgi:pyruvate formate-lyase activating enzyme-like uncharacterized protein